MNSAEIFWCGIFGFIFVFWYLNTGDRRWPGFSNFEAIVSPKVGDSAHGLYKLLVLAILVVIVVFLIGFIKLDQHEGLAWFGDFVGGVIGPILTFLTFVGLLVTIVLQQRANGEARAEAAKADEAFQKQLASQSARASSPRFSRC